MKWQLLFFLLTAIQGNRVPGATDTLNCAICSQEIRGEYVRTKDRPLFYHPACYTQAIKCRLCGIPARAENLDSETGTCARCLALLPRCRACGKAIPGGYVTVQNAEGVFCQECRKNRPSCYICNVPVGNTYWRFPDGRTLCEICNGKAVLDVDGIERIVAETRTLAERHLGMTLRHPYKLRVETLTHESINGRRNPSAPSLRNSLHGREVGKFRQADGQSEIVVLFGLPRDLLYETAAHEYTHAWQADNQLLDQPAELREGLAQWVAAEILRLKGLWEALRRLEAREDAPYGTGYRTIRRLQKEILSHAVP